LVEVNDDLRVRLGGKAMSACEQRFAQLAVVVDLPVQDDDDRPVLVEDRLVAGIQVDDRQTLNAEADVAIDVDAARVRPSVLDDSAHLLDQRAIHSAVRPGDFPRDPTHGRSVTWQSCADPRARDTLAASMAMTLIRRRRRRYDVCFYAPRIGPLLVRDAVTPAGGPEAEVPLGASARAAGGLRVCPVAFGMPGFAFPTTVDGIPVEVRPPYRTRSRFGKVRETMSIFRAVGGHDAEVV